MIIAHFVQLLEVITMKQPRRLTRDEKIRLSNEGYDPSRYVYVREQDGCDILMDKLTGEHLVLKK